MIRIFVIVLLWYISSCHGVYEVIFTHGLYVMLHLLQTNPFYSAFGPPAPQNGQAIPKIIK